MKIKGIEILGGKCIKCGYNKSTAALQFHHSNPTLKEFNFNSSFMSWERYKKELHKCVLLCANCHAELHWNESSDR